MTEGKIDVSVAYATPEVQRVVALRVEEGTTLMQAIELSEITQEFPEADLSPDNLGVFSRKQPPDYVLQAGDRVEIYRPLIADPKEVRRKRAEKQKD